MLNFRSRQDWGCRTPLGAPMRLPVSNIFIHHSVTPPSTNPDADARVLDNIGRSRFGRISYSYMIHPSGVVLEGAGTHVGAHTLNHNSSSFGICFIGDYSRNQPTAEAVKACQDIITTLQGWGIVTPIVSIKPHKSVRATACPGAHLEPLVPLIALAVAEAHGPGVTAPPPPKPPVQPSPNGTHPLAQLAELVRAASKKTLKQGDSGQYVEVLQLLLQRRGFKVAADGKFGGGTKAAVKFAQVLWGIPADGVVGPLTWERLTRAS